MNKNKESNWKKTSVGDSEELFNDVLIALEENCTIDDIDAYKQNEWDSLVKFDQYLIPQFPLNILSGPLKSMAEHAAESIQAPIDLVASVIFGSLSVCLSNKFIVTPKTGWREPLNLYIVSLLEPSTRKSAVFSSLTKPIFKYEKEKREQMELTIKNRQKERRVLEKRQDVLEHEFANDNNPEHLAEIKKINEQLKVLPELHSPSLFVDDVTPQSLVSLMNKNRGKISILTAEGDLFERFKNKNIDQVKYDVYLKPYSCDLLRTDRITRDTEIIENPNMTICVTAQPSVIKNLPSTVHDRGLMARFAYFIPYDNLGHRKSRTEEIL